MFFVTGVNLFFFVVVCHRVSVEEGRDGTCRLHDGLRCVRKWGKQLDPHGRRKWVDPFRVEMLERGINHR